MIYYTVILLSRVFTLIESIRDCGKDSLCLHDWTKLYSFWILRINFLEILLLMHLTSVKTGVFFTEFCKILLSNSNFGGIVSSFFQSIMHKLKCLNYFVVNMNSNSDTNAWCLFYNKGREAKWFCFNSFLPTSV